MSWVDSWAPMHYIVEQVGNCENKVSQVNEKAEVSNLRAPYCPINITYAVKTHSEKLVAPVA